MLWCVPLLMFFFFLVHLANGVRANAFLPHYINIENPRLLGFLERKYNNPSFYVFCDTMRFYLLVCDSPFEFD